MTRRIGSFVALVLALAVPAWGQVRDNGRRESPTGTASISGTVLTDDDSARPVRRAIVTLGLQGVPADWTAVTDDAGRFAFSNLPAARYQLVAAKTGWVRTAYGAKAPGRAGRLLQLAAGEKATATIRMMRGGVISGTIVDQFGQPASGLTLRVMKYGYSFSTGDRRLTPVPSSYVSPDERGAYRVYGLPPGEYYLSVANPSISFNAGRDLHLTSEVDVDEAMKAAQQGPSVPITDVPQRSVGFVQIFYPGTSSVVQATPIALRAGEERSGIDVTISYLPTARVEGVVTGPSGEPVAARVTLVVNDPAAPNSIGIESVRNAGAGPDGRFVFSDLAPGPYVLSAHATMPPASPGDRPQILSTSADLDVPPDGVSGLPIALQEGLTVSGTLKYEGAAPGPNLSALSVRLQPVQNTGGVTVSTASQATVADGRFTLTGVSPGRYRLNVGQPGPQVQWSVRSATLLGQDALDIGADVRQNVTDAVITLTDQSTELTGKMDVPAGASTDYTVILFSADRTHWRPQSRRILTTRVASDATFSFRNVPPGEYLLAPVDEVEPGEWFDPAFLQRLLPSTVRVTIADGEKKVQDIRAGGG